MDANDQLFSWFVEAEVAKVSSGLGPQLVLGFLIGVSQADGAVSDVQIKNKQRKKLIQKVRTYE